MNGAGGQELAASLWSDNLPQRTEFHKWTIQDAISEQIEKLWYLCGDVMDARNELLQLLNTEAPNEDNQYDLYQYLEAEWDPETRTLKPKPFE